MKEHNKNIRNKLKTKSHGKAPNQKESNSSNIMQSLGNHSIRYNMAPEEMLAHYDPNKKIVKKYKFMQGSSKGVAYESVPVAKSVIEQRRIGEGYLEYLKSLPKKKIE